MSSPHFLIICKTCKTALSPPSDRGSFWTAFENFVIQYHRDKGCDCDKWMSDVISCGDDGKLYMDDCPEPLIDDWWRYGQTNMPDTEWRNWPKRSKKCEQYLREQGLINQHGEEIKKRTIAPFKSDTGGA